MKIKSNGSKWLGQRPDSVKKLLAVIEAETLDPKFEKYGNFVYREGGIYYAFGNFLTLSHVFNIEGTKQEIEPIRRAIRRSQRRPEYQAARNNPSLCFHWPPR